MAGLSPAPFPASTLFEDFPRLCCKGPCQPQVYPSWPLPKPHHQ